MLAGLLPGVVNWLGCCKVHLAAISFSYGVFLVGEPLYSILFCFIMFYHYKRQLSCSFKTRGGLAFAPPVPCDHGSVEI